MDIFNRFKSAVKRREVLVDNEMCQLHYRVTAILLLSCAALVASKQHFGDPIDCITKDDVPNKIMDTYCWIHATFTLPSACNKTVGIEVAHPCVDKFVSEKEERVYHKYYQWVYFVLFFQAAFFYAPHFFWKISESKLLFHLTNGLKQPLLEKKSRKEKVTMVGDYFLRNRYRHQSYFYYYTIFELLYLLNVVIQIYVVDEFLGGAFTTYGLDVINYVQMDQLQRVDPMVRVFPRMTKCTFHRFGSSGDVQKYDSLCILPLNIINEKIYIIMWFWFVFLAVITGLWLFYRLLSHFQPHLRYRVLQRRASLAQNRPLRNVLDRLDSGDWFLLSMICKNVDSQSFRYLISHLDKELRNNERAHKPYNMDSNSSIGPHTGKERIIDNMSDAESGDNDEFEMENTDTSDGPLKSVRAIEDGRESLP